MKNRLFSIILILCMVLALLPVTAAAQDTAETRTLYFGKGTVESEEKWSLYTNQELTVEYDEQTDYWEAAPNKLTLGGTDDFEFTTAAPQALVLMENTEIVLYGGSENTIKSARGSVSRSQGIEAKETLEISGTGSLTAEGAADDNCYGIVAVSNVTITGGSVTAIGSGTDGDHCGFFIEEGNLIITGGSLTAKGLGQGNHNSGVYVLEGSVTVEGGSLTAEGGAADRSCYGIRCAGDNASLTITNAEVTATGGEVGGDGDESYGIYCSGDDASLTITNAEVTATGGDVTTGTAHSCGIYCSDGDASLTITNAEVTATGGNVTAVTAHSCGVNAGGDLTIQESAEVTATGGNANAGAGGRSGDAYSYGVNAGGDLTIQESAEVTATGGNANAEEGGYAYSYGVNAGGDLTIQESAKVTATGDNVDVSGEYGIAYSYGVYSNKDLKIIGGMVTAMNAGVGSTIQARNSLYVGAENYVMSIGNAEEATVGRGPMTENKLTKIDPESPVVIKRRTPVIIDPEPGPIPGQTKPPTTPPATEPWVNPFKDVAENDWFYDAVKYCNENKLMDGVSADEFKPTGIVTRAEVWQVLANLAGVKTDTTKAPWYGDAQAWAESVGITDGRNPLDEVTREQLITMLYRYYTLIAKGEFEGGMSAKEFDDFEDVSEWAELAVQWGVSDGIIEGSENKLNPTGGATRAELAAMLMRFDKLLKK